MISKSFYTIFLATSLISGNELKLYYEGTEESYIGIIYEVGNITVKNGYSTWIENRDVKTDSFSYNTFDFATELSVGYKVRLGLIDFEAAPVYHLSYSKTESISTAGNGYKSEGVDWTNGIKINTILSTNVTSRCILGIGANIFKYYFRVVTYENISVITPSKNTTSLDEIAYGASLYFHVAFKLF